MGSFTVKGNRVIPIIFFGMIVIFLMIVSYFVLQSFDSFDSFERNLFPFVAVLGLVFLLLGAELIFLTLKLKIKGRLKLFLLLTGISALCPLAFSILHNLFYALAILTENIVVLKYLMEFLHGTSFFISLIIAPIGFLIGVVGTVILFVRNRRK